MSSRGSRPQHAFGRGRWTVTLVAVLALVLGTAAPVAAVSVPAASAASASAAASASVAARAPGGPVKTSLVGFKAGNIISDAVFTDKSTMTEAQIQSFFNSKVAACRSGYTCLKDFHIDSVNRVADAYCKGYTGAARESAARIIYRVSQACNVNPRVLIVMLQKEQGLVTHTWPSQWRYDAALGQGCPDDAPCNPKYVGFFHQIYGAARQMQIYMEGRYFTWYAPGKTWNILYHPNRACGTSPVYVANKATSALYYYTPYQPNAAALRAGYGTGDACSSYGNRNFYNYFTDWFGPTQISTFTVSAPAITGYVLPGQRITATPRFTPAPDVVTYQWLRNGQPIAGQTGKSYDILTSDVGSALSVKVTAKKTGYQAAAAESTRYATRGTTVQRIAGPDRERTAVEVSRAAWPTGAEAVYISASAGFADALSAAPAASRAGGPLLLSNGDRLADSVGAELRRLVPKRIVLMGGPAVLSEALLSQVKAAVPTAAVSRSFGADRYATSRSIVEGLGASEAVIIATGADFPDALSAAAAGSAMRMPVLLVNGAARSLDEATLATIRKIGAKKVTIVGGDGVVSPEIAAGLTAQGLAVSRLAGADRYQTNIVVNSTFFTGSAPKSLVAAGEDFPDALAASALAGRWTVPLVLSDAECVRMATTDFLRTRGSTDLTLVGGPASLSEDGVRQLRLCS